MDIQHSPGPIYMMTENRLYLSVILLILLLKMF